MQRIKIVHCFFSMETGGAQVLAMEMMNEMCIDNDITLIIINNQWSENILGQLDKRINVYHINRKEGSRNPFFIIKLNMLLMKLKPDIIHSHEPKFAAIVRTTQAKMLQTIHDVGIQTNYYHLYDVVVAISDAVYNDVISRCSATVSKVYNGIPTDAFAQRNEYALLNDEPFKLVQVSRLMHEKKGQDVLLHAVQKVGAEQGVKITLDFVGSGPSMEYLQELTATLGLVDKVNFLGDSNREWVFSHLCDYHLLVQPSRYEGFGLTLLEGFAAGLPVLASNIDGPAEIVAQAPGGFLFENGDVNSCAAELNNIYNLYKSNRISTLMQRTMPVIRQKYSIKSCIVGYLQEYSRLINCVAV